MTDDIGSRAPGEAEDPARIVGVVGAGLIGRAWSLVFARGGCDVRVTDASARVRDALPERLAADAAVLERHGLIADVDGALARVRAVASVEDAVGEAELVQENGPEDLDVKRALFETLDRSAPRDAVLASSTSAIVASRFTESLEGRERCLVAHPVNPPHLVPLVELCGAPWTAPEVVDRCEGFYRDLGQVPVRVEREIDGFVLNRLQGAVLAEAFRLVGEGVISPEDLDRTMSDGLGLRWSFLGPFATIELNAPGGIADYCRRYTGFYRRLAEDPPGAGAFDEANVERIVARWPHAPEPDRLAAAAAARDDSLGALAAHKRRSGDAPSPAGREPRPRR